MALEDIKKMTRPLSEEKKVASHDAPEDYLKRAVEQFIIEFPEFEDLQGQDLYDKMEEKGYFSDQYAMSEPEGIMQLASHSGGDIIQSAIIWAAGLPQFGSIDAVVISLQDGSTDINGLVNAYMDARVDSN